MSVGSHPWHRLVVMLIIFGCLCVFFSARSRTTSTITDDAFISFRYAKHLAEGKGLVYNEGERVEGYTNFLWVLILAAGHAVGLDIPKLSQTLSIFCAAALVLAVSLFSREHFQNLRYPFFSYIAPLLFIVNPLYWEHMRTGLETILFTFLTFLGTAIYLNQWRKAYLPYLTGFILGLAFYTRPEGALWLVSFAVTDLVWIVFRRNGHTNARLDIIKVIGIFAVMASLQLAWRLSYYGDWFPNTFYAKSISNYSWGTFRTKQFLLATGFLPVIALFAALVLRGKWVICMVLPMVLLGAYNWQIGGDFIFTGRFLIPLLPAIYLLVQEMFRTTFAIRVESENSAARFRNILLMSVRVLIPIFFVFGATWEYRVAKGEVKVHRTMNAANFRVPDFINNSTRPTDIIAVNGAGIVPFYTDRTCIDMVGLTDRHIASFGVVDNNYPPAHQRADSDYVLDRRPRMIIISDKSPLNSCVAAIDYMLKNARLRELYTLTTFKFGMSCYVLNDDPVNIDG